ncbi:MAG: hypothetical protein AB7O55_06590 [Lautropia sp.]
MSPPRICAVSLVALFAGAVAPATTLLAGVGSVAAGVVLGIRHVVRCARRDGWLAEL